MKIPVKYQARLGYGVSQEKVEVIAPEIEKLTTEAYELGKAFGACELVDIAKRKNSMFHDLFEWNDKKAAQSQRLSRARQVLACFTTVVESGSEIGDIRLRGTYNVALPADDIVLEDTDPEVEQHLISLEGFERPRRTYIPVSVVLSNRDVFEELEADFKLRLKRLRTEYITLKKAHDEVQQRRILPVFDAIEDYLEQQV
jgi:hypothetical protein